MTRVVLKAPKRHKGGFIKEKKTVTSKATKNLLHIDEIETAVKPVKGQTVAYLRQVATVKITSEFNSSGIEIGAEIPFACKPDDLQSIHKNMDRLAALIERRLVKHIHELDAILKTLGDRRR